MKFIAKASDTEKIVKSLKSNSGIYLVPAFTESALPIGMQMLEVFLVV